MGDLNFHNKSENEMVEEFGYRDMWSESHFSEDPNFNDSDEGFTFDVDVCFFIFFYIYFFIFILFFIFFYFLSIFIV